VSLGTNTIEVEMSYQKKNIYLNVDTKGRVNYVNSKPSTLFLGNDQVYEGDTFTYTINLIDSTGTYVPVSSGDFLLSICEDSDNILTQSYNNDFNHPEDWSQVDLQAGKLCCNVSLYDVSGMDSFFGGLSEQAATVEIWHRPLGAKWNLLATWPITIYATAYPASSEDYSTWSSMSSSSSSSVVTNSSSSESSIT
jgi:hypothetical protein